MDAWREIWAAPSKRLNLSILYMVSPEYNPTETSVVPAVKLLQSILWLVVQCSSWCRYAGSEFINKARDAAVDKKQTKPNTYIYLYKYIHTYMYAQYMQILYMWWCWYKKLFPITISQVPDIKTQVGMNYSFIY